jgi:hypothetical protein
MTNRAHHTFAITLALALVSSAGALAAGPLKGKTYEGGAPSSGIDKEGHRLRTRATGNIILRVSGSGRSVTVRFSSSAPVLYCTPQQGVQLQSGKAAPISRSGTFKVAVGERFKAGPGPPAIVQVVSGRFSGRRVTGTVHTSTAPECSGVASFSATAR